MIHYYFAKCYSFTFQLPQTAMYWGTDPLFGNLNIRRVMIRDRFNKISQYLHCNDRSTNPARGQPGHDKLHHVRPFLQEVLDHCLQNYNPHQNTSVDEAMVKFRGRLAFRQYLPAKPTKYGIKVWMRGDPTNGYTNEFQVYTGKEQGNREVGLSTRVVLDMTRKVWGKHHIVNIDNYFTSPDLLQKLLDNGTYGRGTVRSNRKGFPAQRLKPRDIKEQGQFTTAQNGEMTACLWKDKKHIHLLSTAENPATLDSTVTRKSKNGDLREVRAPSIIPQYNDNMNGVDYADQQRTEYSTYRSSRKWWQYLFWFLFDVALTNGFILMKESANHQNTTKSGRPKKLTMLEYRMELARLLIGGYVENERVALATIGAGHHPKTAEDKKKGRCRWCSKKKVRREVINTCGQCKVHLCTDCFQPYHRDLIKQRQ